MKSLYALISIGFSLFAWSDTLFSDESQKISQELMLYKNIQISQKQCGGPCTSKSVIDAKVLQKTKIKFIAGENPTSSICEQLKGSPDIFYDVKKAEISVCVFKDKSFLVTWDLLK